MPQGKEQLLAGRRNQDARRDKVTAVWLYFNGIHLFGTHHRNKCEEQSYT